MTCHIIQTFPQTYNCLPAVEEPNLSPLHFSFVTDKDLCGRNILTCQLLSCYVYAQESITSFICSVAMSLYDINSRACTVGYTGDGPVGLGVGASYYVR